MRLTATGLPHLRDILDECAQRGLPVRARGTSRGLGDIGDLEGAQIDMRESLRDVRVVAARVHETPRLVVRAEAGATVADVIEVLGPRHLTLPNVPGWDQLSIVGCTVTGSHGTGLRLPPLCEMVVAVEAMLLDPSRGVRQVAVIRDGVDPDSLELPPGTEAIEDRELFDAIRVGAWWLGVVTAMTYETRPAYFLEEYRELMPWSSAKERLDELVAAPELEGLIAWVNPYRHAGRRRAAIATYRRHPGPPSGRRSFASRFGGCSPLRQMGTWAVAGPNRWRPWIVHNALGTTRMKTPAVMPSHEALSFGSPNLFPVSACEVAVHVSRTVELTDLLIAHYGELRDRDRWTSSPIGLRFTAPATAMLAPQYDRASCMIEQVLVRGNREVHELHRAFQDRLRGHADARPHWGQYLAQPPRSLLTRYPRAEAFLRQVARYNGHGLLGRELHALPVDPQTPSSEEIAA